MSVSPVVVTVEDFFYERLTAVLTPDVDVYSGRAPEDAPYPLCIFAYLDSTDTNAVAANEQRVMTRLDYVVRITDRSESFISIAAFAQVADVALQGAKGPSEIGGQVLSCLRVEPFVQRETDPNSALTYLSLGGVYRIQAQEGAP